MELVQQLPDEIIQDYLRIYDDQLIIWDHVVDTNGDVDLDENADESDWIHILVIYIQEVPWPIPVKGYCFEDDEIASEEAYRANKLMGLSDEDIGDRIYSVMEREDAGSPIVTKEARELFEASKTNH